MKLPYKFFESVFIFLLLTLIPFQSSLAEKTEGAEARGKVEFIDSCSLCHGEDAKGSGIFSSMLKVKTPDLTQLSKNNNGVFPFKDVYLIIDGKESIKQHGPRYMPIWGDRFKSITWFTVNEEYADTLVAGTIFELILYLDSIQE